MLVNSHFGHNNLASSLIQNTINDATTTLIFRQNRTTNAEDLLEQIVSAGYGIYYLVPRKQGQAEKNGTHDVIMTYQ